MNQPLMFRLPNGLYVPHRVAMKRMSHIKPRTRDNKGKVFTPRDRLRRDELGEKLEDMRRRQIFLQRETGTRHGPFLIKDWMK